MQNLTTMMTHKEILRQDVYR